MARKQKSKSIQVGNRRGSVVSKLKIERIKKGLSQIDLWMRTGIPQWRLSLIERGIAPRPEEAKRIAQTLGAEIPDLFGGVDERTRNEIPRTTGDGGSYPG
jgi:transcriptional regulator with XRE-family HTH domain